MNLPTTIGVIIVAAVFVAIIVKGIIDRKKGKTSCSCSCSGCAMRDKCHKK
jgi:hypothetical protein